MAYQVTPEFWLKTEADRVEAIVLMRKNWSKTWTAAALQEELQALDLTYTVDQVQLILDELVKRKVLELPA